MARLAKDGDLPGTHVTSTRDKHILAICTIASAGNSIFSNIESTSALWNQAANNIRTAADISEALEAVVPKLDSSTVNHFLQLSEQGAERARCRKETIRVYKKFACWPWQLTQFPVKKVSKDLCYRLLVLGEETGWSKEQVTHLLDCAVEQRVKLARAQKKPGVGSRACLNLADIEEATKSAAQEQGETGLGKLSIPLSEVCI